VGVARRQFETERYSRQSSKIVQALFLACLILIIILMGKAYPGFERLRKVLPLVVLLALLTGSGIRRRQRQVGDIQQEIREVNLLSRPRHDDSDSKGGPTHEM
jgi:peptidoglycan/LPS O-acetylase OafA/YrhL